MNELPENSLNKLDPSPKKKEEKVLDPETMQEVPKRIVESSDYSQKEIETFNKRLDFIKSVIRDDLGYKRDFAHSEEDLINNRFWQLINQPDNTNIPEIDRTQNMIDKIKEELEKLPKPDVADNRQAGEIINYLSEEVYKFARDYSKRTPEENKKQEAELLQSLADNTRDDTKEAITALQEEIERIKSQEAA